MKNSRIKLILVFGIIFVSGFLFAEPANAATLTVNSPLDNGDGTCTEVKCTLRDAITNSSSGDTIEFGDLTGTITLTQGDVAIEHTLTVAGPGADVLTVDGNAQDLIFHIVGNFESFEISGLTLSNANGSYGGAIGDDGYSLDIIVSNCIFLNNVSDPDYGGAIYFDGGAEKTLTITNSTFTNNSLSAVLLYSGNLVVSGSTFTENTSGYGGAIYLQSYNGEVNATISNSTFSNNSASATSDYGGGAIYFYDGGDLIISNSTFSENTASGNDGAIYNYSGNNFNITNSTFYNNASDEGGIVDSDNVGLTTITNSTFYDSSPSQENIFYSNGNFIITNSIVYLANNSCGNGFTSDGHNIDSGTSCGFDQESDLNSTDPLLDLLGLQDNGGSVETIALLAGSPAVDAGDDASAPATDARGITRPQGLHSDIGAYEYEVATIHTVTASVGSHGLISPSGDVSVDDGDNQSFTITPDTHYHVADVLVDDVSVGAVTSYEFTNVTADHTISVTFVIDTHTLTYTAGDHGSITGTSPQTVNYGADGSAVTAVPDAGYHFVNWSDDSTNNPRTDTSVIDNISVTANFARTSSGGGGCYNCYINPSVPSDGFKMSINGGAATTSNRNVFLGFNAGADIKKMAISMTGDFTDASQEDYVASKQWDLCSKFGGLIKNPTCPDGTYTVYAKFYTAWGRTSDFAVASSTITLKFGAVVENLQQYNNLPFTNPFTKNLQYRQTNNDVKRLQIFLNSDPNTKVADSGAGSPGKETNYFGILTYKAVTKFQEKYAKDILAPWGFVKGTGYVGRTTLAKINELMGNK